VRDLFIAMPSNATKKFPRLSLRQAVEQATGMALPRLATKTVNNYTVKMASLLNWAMKEEFIDRNPARGLKVEAGVGDSKERVPFSPQQLQAIFEAPLYTGCQNDGGGYAKPGVNRPKGTRFWIPLLGLFHGMRLNECCQLRVEDITERDGVPVMLVRKGQATRRSRAERPSGWCRYTPRSLGSGSWTSWIEPRPPDMTDSFLS
jgi:integrase